MGDRVSGDIIEDICDGFGFNGAFFGSIILSFLQMFVCVSFLAPSIVQEASCASISSMRANACAMCDVPCAMCRYVTVRYDGNTSHVARVERGYGVEDDSAEEES